MGIGKEFEVYKALLKDERDLLWTSKPPSYKARGPLGMLATWTRILAAPALLAASGYIFYRLIDRGIYRETPDQIIRGVEARIRGRKSV